MKKLIIIFFSLLFVYQIQAQEVYPVEFSNVFTDRAFYISGEEIQFSGVININTSNKQLSDIVYIELIDPIGNKINQLKLYLNRNTFQGKILIPESIISGYYFLRTYTKWMRNGKPEDFGKVLLKIVNPFLMDVQRLPDSLYLLEPASETFEFIKDSSLKPTYQKGELIDIDLKNIGINFYNLLQFSIVPQGSQYFAQDSEKKNSRKIEQIKYYPETKGLSLSGSITINEKTSPYHLIYLNIMGEKDFMSVYSDSSGRFHFALPHEYGIHELMLGATFKAGGEIEILADNDFDIEPVFLKVPRFTLNKEEEMLSLKLARQYQVNKWYYDSVEQVIENRTAIPFYEKPYKIIDFDFYVPLDSMSQYFTDIPSYVLVKKRKGKRYLQLLGENEALSIHEPLIMVDWIPVAEADRILAMNPSNVKKIEIINRQYFHGNKQYGGIIHVQTREGNLADLKFPESNIYLNYQFPEKTENKNVELQFPGTSFNKVLTEYESPKINFTIPKLPGKYVLLIQQLDKTGEKTVLHFPFNVISNQ